jgi:hypothetical protein
MTKRKITKLIHEGQYIAEVEIELSNEDEGWSPYISLDDAQKLDDVRQALREGKLGYASSLAKVYTITPIAI